MFRNCRKYNCCKIYYSVEDAIKFYTRLGFCDFAEFFEADKYRYIDGCKPMYIEIP